MFCRTSTVSLSTSLSHFLPVATGKKAGEHFPHSCTSSHALTLTSVCSTDSLAAAEAIDVITDEASEIATGSGTQSMTQEEDWEDLADTKVGS